VFSFEPVPQTFKVLKKSAALGGHGQIIALPYGVSYQNKSMQVQYYPHCPALSTSYPELWSKKDNAFLLALDGAINNISKKLWCIKLMPKFLKKWFAKWLRSKPVTVDCQLRTITSTIDEYQIDHIDLLKIDCEGAELDALRGIKEQHWAIIKNIVVEVHNIEGRLKTIMDLFAHHGLTKIIVETEKGFENTGLRNIHASRPDSL
jgi:nonribosomal peptide synthetase DhbF